MFTFSARGVSDIDHYLYGWSNSPSNRVDAVGGLGGSASVRLEPPGDGPQTLYVQSVDRAGHRSGTWEHRIYVRAGNGALSQWSFEGNADDTAFLGDRHGTLHGGAAYVLGVNGNAVQLTGDGHMGAPNTVDTRGSFSVSAWVRVDDPVGTHAVVSQDGVTAAAFQLGYRTDGDDAGWFFALPRTDSVGPVVDAVRVPGTAVPGDWTHLAAVYDAEKDLASLFVNGEAHTLPNVSTTWRSTGGLRVGNALVDGAVANQWRGLVDEVRVYDRTLLANEVTAAVSGADVRVADWQFEDETGKTARASMEGGPMAVLTETGASFEETEETGNGVLRLNGGYAETSEPVVRTDRSFAVMARVSVDPDVDDGVYTVLSQDGESTCGFCLSYEQVGGERDWVFTMPRSGSDGTAGVDTVRMAATQTDGESTHLAAVFDCYLGYVAALCQRR